MTDNLDGRMLLSHNFSLPEEHAPSLTREEFAQLFSQGLSVQVEIACKLIENPHWVVEVRYQTSRYSPSEVGQLCADALAHYRNSHQVKDFYVLALGGVKTTPATSPSPSLQPGEWGVDVVETHSPEEFLAEINWDKLAGAKPSENVFKIKQPA